MTTTTATLPPSAPERTPSSRGLAVLLGLGLAFAAVPWAPQASAAIDSGATALEIAQAMFVDPLTVTGAAFVSKPAGTPTAVSDTPMAGFPLVGPTYGILTSGDAHLAPTPDCCPYSGADIGGPSVRGDTDYDVTILRIDFEAPAGNCLTAGTFRFLSEEFPEWVNTQYNDAFVLELDSSTWTTSGGDIVAPDNFAFDPSGNPISINAVGDTSMSAAEADGTTYDGATPLLKASVPLTEGPHSLYVSIFDQGDHIYDSAVFIDGFHVTTEADGECEPGAEPLLPIPDLPGGEPPSPIVECRPDICRVPPPGVVEVKVRG